MPLRICIYLALLMLSLGCSNEDVSGVSPLKNISLNVSFINFEEKLLTAGEIPRSTIFRFPFISGHIWGITSTENIIIEELNEAGKINLELNESIFTNDTKPESISIVAANDGLEVFPTDTKFGRLGTFAYSPEGLLNSARSYSLFDAEYNVSFMLIYVDKASTIARVLPDVDVDITIDLDLKQKGFYAVKFEDNKHTAFNPSKNVYFAIDNITVSRATMPSITLESKKTCSTLKCR